MLQTFYQSECMLHLRYFIITDMIQNVQQYFKHILNNIHLLISLSTATSFGIALPSWLVSKENSVWVSMVLFWFKYDLVNICRV
jgi:hypothetical protein